MVTRGVLVATMTAGILFGQSTESSGAAYTISEILSPDCPGFVGSGQVLGPTSVSCGFQTASSDFGINRVGAVDEEGTSVVSIWVDEFTFSGLTGPGTATFVWSVEGGIVGDARLSVAELFGASSTLLSTGGTQTINQTLSVTIPFSYDVTFSGGLFVQGTILDDRPPTPSLNFLNTVQLTTILAPAGATLRTGSGTVYPLETGATVPEPATLLLVGGGFGIELARRRGARRPRR